MNIRIVALAGLLLLLAATAPAEPATPENAEAVARDAYLYCYPLLVMDQTRRKLTGVLRIPGRGPYNAFNHLRAFPTAGFKVVIRPNFDTLYSTAWLDLRNGPVFIDVPDTNGRYYVMQMMDMWTEVIAAPGLRTNNGAATRYAVVLKGTAADLPTSVERIESATPFVWIINRFQTNGQSDFEAIRVLQDALKITAPENVNAVAIDAPSKPVHELSGEEFFRYACAMMTVIPAHDADSAMLDRMKSIGLVPTANLDVAALSPDVQSALHNAPAAAQKAMQENGWASTKSVNGWLIPLHQIGRFGSEYLARAAVAKNLLGANIPEDVVYPLAIVDADGAPLDGRNRYVIRFERDALPPVNAFWSITLYGEDGFPVPNAANRYSLADRDPLVYNADGSLDLYVQDERPDAQPDANWIPAPKGPFNLLLRLYWPKPSVLEGGWAPPPLRRVAP